MKHPRYLPGDAPVVGIPPRHSGSTGLVMGRAVGMGDVLLTFAPVQEVPSPNKEDENL